MTDTGCGTTTVFGASRGQGFTRSLVAPAGAAAGRDPGVVVWHDHRHRDDASFVKRSEWYVELLRAASATGTQ